MNIIKVPFGNGSLNKNPGAKFAPDVIIEQLHDLFLNEKGIDSKLNISQVNVDDSNIEQTQKNIYEYVANLNFKNKTMMLGGDHSITYPSFQAFSTKFKNPGMIFFDAHPDCCQVMDTPTHEDIIINLINQGHLKAENILMIGIRNWDEQEYEFLKEKNINLITLDEILEDGVRETSERMLAFVQQFDGLYASIDIDVVDPAFAPGTGYVEPAGMTSRQLIYFIHKIRLLKNLKLVDLVEIAPDKDLNNLTTKLGAKIIKELM